MTHDQEEIIVFRQFENAIDASIAKSKLDAYGVPCFLTEENITNLYPGQHYLPFRVRLHVFKKMLRKRRSCCTKAISRLTTQRWNVLTAVRATCNAISPNDLV